MIANPLILPIRALCIALFVLLASLASAQVDNVYVYGTVKDYATSKKLDGITVTVFKNGGKLAEVVTNASGKYEFNLDYGSDYKILYSKSGMVDKNITIDTKNIPEEERVGGHGMNVEMTLFSELPGIDFTVLQQPIGKARFDPATKEVTWDLAYTEQVRAEIARLMKEYDDRKKREANLDEDFAKLMSQGDAAMAGADYKKAVDSFTGALALKANDPVAKAKLSDAKMKFDELNAAKKDDEKYASLIKEADGLFGKKDYENAKAKYQAASEVKDKETYPKEKMKECQAFIDELAKKAEEEKKARELEEKYKAAIAAADVSLKGDKLEDARTNYTEASGLKPAEKYPQDQLALIAKKLEERAKKEEEERKQKELDAQYQAVLTAADAAFKAANYEQARTKYTEASGLKPAEKYPKDQLAAIDKKLEELAKKAEEERLAKELEEKYKAAIAAGDAAFKQDKFDAAKAGYNEALGLKPKEKYPTDQLAAIDRRIAELAKKAEEEKKQKELDDKYNEAIAKADAAFQGQGWEDARKGYNEALKLKAQEKYPKDQLIAIDKAIEEAARKAAEEERQKELDAKYQLLIGSADGLLAQDKLDLAKAKYQEALAMRPDQKYPKTKITEIDGLLAERARLAEEERKRKELDDKYNGLIASADKAYDGTKYSDALNDYTDALKLKPEEQYPKDRIADIQTRLDAEAQAKAEKARLEREKAELDKRYNDLVAAADRAFKGKDYETARSGYTDALGVKPEEKHPKERLDEIVKLLADLAAKNEADSLRAAQEAAERARLEEERRRKEDAEKDINTRYNEAVAKGDIAFGGEKWDDARARYTEALSIKPEEAYPKERLEAIEKLLADRERAKLDAEAAEAERRRLAEEARLKAEADAEAARLASMDEQARLAAEKARNEAYMNKIAEADAALAAEQYQEARDLYTQSLDIKPEEVYPQSKIEQIDKLLAELERQRREAELAAMKKEDEPPPPPKREGTRIDTKKETDAEEFMRAAREREEQEKYERIKKLKADLSEEERTNTAEWAGRQEGSLRANQAYVESNEKIYAGSDAMRRRNEEELAAQREALARRQAEVRMLADQNRGAATAQNEALATAVVDRDRTLREQHSERVSTVEEQKEQWSRIQADEIAAGQARRQQAMSEVERLAEERAAIQDRGTARAADKVDRVAAEKESHADRQRQLANRSEDARMAAKEQLESLPRSEQRSFADYNRGQLANEYPQGVTEESYTEGNKVIIRRIVVQGNKADEYKKVIGKAGTSYFKNGLSITGWVWARDTEE